MGVGGSGLLVFFVGLPSCATQPCSINKVYYLDSNKSTFSVTFMDAAERLCPNFILDHSLADKTFNVLGFFCFVF